MTPEKLKELLNKARVIRSESKGKLSRYAEEIEIYLDGIYKATTLRGKEKGKRA